MANFERTLNKFGVPIYQAALPGSGKIGLLQPKPKHRFRVRVAGFGNNRNQQDLTRQVATVSRPKISYEPITVDSYNSRAYYCGKHTWEEITLSLRDDITNTASKLCNSQVQKQLNHFQQTGWPAAMNYKFDMWIETMDGGNFKILESWFIEGCFLTNVDHDSAEYSSADPMMINLSIRADNMQIWGEDEVADLSGGASSRFGGVAPRNPEGLPIGGSISNSAFL